MKKQIDISKWVVHLGAMVTLIVLVLLFITNTLSFNPIQNLEHQTGKAALVFLILSLACTPLNTITGWKFPIKRKQALGVYGFMFAAVHLLIFLWLDYGFQFKTIWLVISNSIFIWVGGVAFVMLSALAITSLKKSKKQLKKLWKPLHRLAYLISPLVVVHFILVQKGNIFSLQGNLWEPLIYGSIVLFLLLLRIPPIKRALINIRTRFQNHERPVNPV